jgi:hypothetical protein
VSILVLLAFLTKQTAIFLLYEFSVMLRNNLTLANLTKLPPIFIGAFAVLYCANLIQPNKLILGNVTMLSPNILEVGEHNDARLPNVLAESRSVSNNN